jgi:hypothetical protein
MGIEAGIAAFFLPRRVDLSGGITEHGAEAVLDTHPFAEFFFDGVNAHLRDVGPHAQDVRKILDLDDTHYRGLAIAFRFGASAASSIDLGQARFVATGVGAGQPGACQDRRRAHPREVTGRPALPFLSVRGRASAASCSRSSSSKSSSSRFGGGAGGECVTAPW